MTEFYVLTILLGGFVAVYLLVWYGLDLLYELIYALTKRRVPREVRPNRRKA